MKKKKEKMYFLRTVEERGSQKTRKIKRVPKTEGAQRNNGQKKKKLHPERWNK